MADEGSSSPWAEFAEWFLQYVFVPLLPVAIVAFADRMLHANISDWHRCEAILVYPFVLPILYVDSARGPLTNRIYLIIFSVTAGTGLLLYAFGHLTVHHPEIDSTRIYHTALALDAVYVVSATIRELYKAINRDRAV